jgi:hypothetical protein
MSALIMNNAILSDFKLKRDAILNKLGKAEDLSELKKLVNLSAEIHNSCINAQNKIAKENKVKNPKEQNWDVWNELTDEQVEIETLYFNVKDKYHSKHWDVHGFNAY